MRRTRRQIPWYRRTPRKADLAHFARVLTMVAHHTRWSRNWWPL